MITSNVLQEDLPEECSITLEHALIHLDSAIASEHMGDLDQVYHDVYIVAKIAIEVFNRLEREITRNDTAH